MPSPPERGTHPADGQVGPRTAFGLQLEFGPGIEVEGLGLQEAPVSSGPVTKVGLDPEQLEDRWSAVAAEAICTRRLCVGGEVILTVDVAEPTGYLVWVKGVGRMLVTADGGEVLCSPLPDRDGWEFILPAQILPLAATLRGYEVLHAAGLVLRGGAALLSGSPGAGKSSLAAALLRRGAKLLSDDCVALEPGKNTVLCHPGAGILYLRDPEHDRLSGEERALLGPSRDFAGKLRYAPATTGAPAPFAALFLLERAERGPAIEPIENADPFDLLAATFNLSVRTPERLTRQLDLVGELVASGRIHRLRVLPGMDATQLAESVDRYLAEDER